MINAPIAQVMLLSLGDRIDLLETHVSEDHLKRVAVRWAKGLDAAGSGTKVRAVLFKVEGPA